MSQPTQFTIDHWDKIYCALRAVGVEPDQATEAACHITGETREQPDDKLMIIKMLLFKCLMDEKCQENDKDPSLKSLKDKIKSAAKKAKLVEDCQEQGECDRCDWQSCHHHPKHTNATN